LKQKFEISLLELGIVVEGQETAGALQEIVFNARHAESLGFKRIWLAEHHNMISVSTAATAVLIGHVAEKTSTIRVGAGGIMMPNHTPLAVAEQFGTLNSLYPGRIDLGLGRAPGTDQLTAAALRRNNLASQFDFPDDVRSLQRFLSTENSSAKVRAFPGEGEEIPIWILGSSTDSAYLAAELGLPYAFASHFAPTQMFDAIKIYRREFKPSIYTSSPHLMVAANVIVADTDEEANFLKTSLDQLAIGMVTGNRVKLPPPVEQLPPLYYHPEVNFAISRLTTYTFAGAPGTVQSRLHQFVESTGAQELIVTNHIYDKQARARSLELLATSITAIRS
jgi:luciferase family oxidoreductase group 1